MQVRVLYFAAAKDRAGIVQETVDLSEGATVSDLAAEVVGRHPTLESLVRRSRFAVNQTFAAPDAALADGDEAALIPPVAGG